MSESDPFRAPEADRPQAREYIAYDYELDGHHFRMGGSWSCVMTLEMDGRPVSESKPPRFWIKQWHGVFTDDRERVHELRYAANAIFYSQLRIEHHVDGQLRQRTIARLRQIRAHRIMHLLLLYGIVAIGAVLFADAAAYWLLPCFLVLFVKKTNKHEGFFDYDQQQFDATGHDGSYKHGDGPSA